MSMSLQRAVQMKAHPSFVWQILIHTDLMERRASYARDPNRYASGGALHGVRLCRALVLLCVQVRP